MSGPRASPSRSAGALALELNSADSLWRNQDVQDNY
jgi:hypothetical protein